MCRRIRNLLATDVQREWWSRRARDTLAEARLEYPWLTTDGTTVTAEPNGELCWWTFAGRAVNASLATALQNQIAGKISHDNYAVKIEAGTTMADIEPLVVALRRAPPETLLPTIDADALTALKFSDCLPPELAQRMLQVRAMDMAGLNAVVAEPVRFVALQS
jgi:ATP-dependent Lhr-like helicase